MLKPNPIRIPINRSVSRIAATVTKNGRNWFSPSRHICLNSFGLASFQPVMIRTAARQDRGIWFSHAGSRATHRSSNRPWTRVASLVLPPALMFTELRTITEVTGKPPISPAATIAHALGDQFPIGRRDPLLRIELVDRFQVQERLQRSDQGDRHGRHVHLRVGQGREVRPLQEAEEAGQAVRHRDLHQVRAADGPRAAQASQEQAQADPGEHDDQRRRNQRLLEPLDLVPHQQDDDRDRADDDGSGMQGAEEMHQRGERVLVVRFFKRHRPQAGSHRGRPGAAAVSESGSARWPPAGP